MYRCTLQTEIKLNRLLQNMNQKSVVINSYSEDLLTVEYFGNTESLYVKHENLTNVT